MHHAQRRLLRDSGTSPFGRNHHFTSSIDHRGHPAICLEKDLNNRVLVGRLDDRTSFGQKALPTRLTFTETDPSTL